MVVDSSALPEQVVDAVVQSAFRSAGQRCSALRLLCVHEEVADKLLAMLAGAMAELHAGDPREPVQSWSVDVGPVIDAEAHANLSAHVARLAASAKLIARTALPADLASPPRTSRRSHSNCPASRRCARRSSARCCTCCAGAASPTRWWRRSTRWATA
jgi:delta 1-pyrroline-5-carboxylate dehydrogenase